MPRSRGRPVGRRPPPPPTPLPAQRRLLSAVYNFLQSLFGTLARVWQAFWRLIIGASILIGLVAGALFLFPPRLTVEMVGESSDPYFVSFVIKNAWVLPMRDVTPFLGLSNLSMNYGRGIINVSGDCAKPDAVRITNPNWKPRYLGVDESFSEPIAEAFNLASHSFAGGDILFGATFKPWIWPFTIQRAFHFVSRKERDGTVHWVPEASATPSCK